MAGSPRRFGAMTNRMRLAEIKAHAQVQKEIQASKLIGCAINSFVVLPVDIIEKVLQTIANIILITSSQFKVKYDIKRSHFLRQKK